MPLKIIKQDNRFYIIFETKWHGIPKTLGVAGAPPEGYATMAEAKAAKSQVTIMRAAGISAATLLF